MRLPVFAFALATLIAPAAIADEITVFAAASLKTALDEIATEWQKNHDDTVVISYASSSKLAKQIQEGAPADLFISASPEWVDAVEGSGDIDPATRKDLLGNTLVLVAAGQEAPPVEVAPGFDLAGMLDEGRLAMALVDSVPAGVYGKAALTSLGVWDKVEGSVAQADNVRAALGLVASGEAPFGIVYGTDAHAEPKVTVVGTFPADSHPAIIYPIARTATSKAPDAQAFLDFVKSPAAFDVFRKYGFSAAPAPQG